MLEARLIQLANELRTQMDDEFGGHGRYLPLNCDPALTEVARQHSEDMCNQEYISHLNQGLSQESREFGERLHAAGAEFVRWRQNVAQGSATAELVHDLWLVDRIAWGNLIDRQHLRIGVGYVACNGQHYWTQILTH